MSDTTASTSSDTMESLNESNNHTNPPRPASKKNKSPKGKADRNPNGSGAGETTNKIDGDTMDVSVNMHFQQLEEPEVPLFIEAKDLKYEVDVKPTKANLAKKRTLLHSINAHFTPGELVAVMGPTGAGKSTLLNVLARRNKIGVTGDLLYNGKPADRDFKRQLAYVLQDDILFPHLTVQQTLSYTAQLRQPGHLSYEEKVVKVDEVISALNLTKARDTIIGGPFVRGVSGGERKRVNIGTQLLSNPSAIFFDEPTSGLDTSTAFSLVSTMRDIAKAGYTVLSTIHQPASHIFDLFDKILLLLDGHVVYFGPQKHMRTYLRTNLNIDVPMEHNPADFLMGNVIDEEIRTGNPAIMGELKKKAIDAWLAHGPHSYDPAFSGVSASKAKKQIKKNKGVLLKSVAGAQAKQAASERPKFPISWAGQLRVLGHRAIRRAASAYLQRIPIIQQLLVAVITGCVWWQTPYDESGYRDILGGGFFIAVFAGGFSPIIDAIFNFPPERVVITRERSEGSFRMSAYFISKILGDIPFQFISPILFTIISYWMVGMRKEAGSFFMFLALMLAANFAASGAGLVISATVKDLRIATVTGTVTLLLFMLLAGYYRPVVNLPVWFGWLHYISFIKYLYDGVVQTLFLGVFLPGPTGGITGDAIAAAISPVIPLPGWNIMALAGWGLLYRIMAFVGLKLSFKLADGK